MSIARRKHNMGVSLVELLVAMVVGLFILAGVIKVMGDSKGVFLLEQEFSYTQENARFVVDELGQEIRMAGYFGCSGQTELTNTLDLSSLSEGWMFRSDGIRGFEKGGQPDTFDTMLDGTDVLVINRGIQDDDVIVSAHNHTLSNPRLRFSGPVSFRKGEVLYVSDKRCRHSAIFKVRGPNDPDNPSKLFVRHGAVAGSPGNCYKALSKDPDGEPYTCDGTDDFAPPTSGNGIQMDPGSSVGWFKSTGYFVADSAITGQPTLYRTSLILVGGNPELETQELLSGVEDFEVIYGIDNDATADCTVNRYYSANEIMLDTVDTGTGNYVAWERVLTARVTLILRSSREAFQTAQAVDLGDGDTFNDQYLRQKVRTTVALRNRIGGCA